MKRRFWISILAQLALLSMLAIGLAKTGLSGRQLLIGTLLWFAAVVLWNTLAPSSFFLSLGKRNRMKTAFVFAFGYFFQLFIFGWLAPLAAGIYRLTIR